MPMLTWGSVVFLRDRAALSFGIFKGYDAAFVSLPKYQTAPEFFTVILVFSTMFSVAPSLEDVYTRFPSTSLVLVGNWFDCQNFNQSSISAVIITDAIGGLRMWLSLESPCLAFMKPWLPSAVPQKVGVVIHTCDPSSQRVEIGEQEVQGHLCLQIKLRATWAACDPVFKIILTTYCHHHVREQNHVSLPCG